MFSDDGGDGTISSSSRMVRRSRSRFGRFPVAAAVRDWACLRASEAAGDLGGAAAGRGAAFLAALATTLGALAARGALAAFARRAGFVDFVRFAGADALALRFEAFLAARLAPFALFRAAFALLFGAFAAFFAAFAFDAFAFLAMTEPFRILRPSLRTP